MDLKEIRSLIDLMKKNGIAVFKLERENFKITLKTDDGAIRTVAQPQPLSAPNPAPAPAGETAKAPQASADPNVKEIKSPMVGTFYTAPSPDAKPFVEVGQKIEPETVVCIVEAMKVMNEIKAEVSGTVLEVCAENGKPVQFGQALLRVK